MYENHCILGVHLTDRLTEVMEVQKLLTAYGRQIKTRLGLHEVEKDYSAPSGVILLEMAGEESGINELTDKLNALDGVEVKRMTFEHPV